PRRDRSGARWPMCSNWPAAASSAFRRARQYAPRTPPKGCAWPRLRAVRRNRCCYSASSEPPRDAAPGGGGPGGGGRGLAAGRGGGSLVPPSRRTDAVFGLDGPDLGPVRAGREDGVQGVEVVLQAAGRDDEQAAGSAAGAAEFVRPV